MVLTSGKLRIAGTMPRKSNRAVSEHFDDQSTRYRVEAITRAVGLLRQFNRTMPRRSIDELIRSLGTSASLTRRMLRTLEQHRLVEKNPDTGRYRLGLKLFEFGSKAIGAIDLRRQARPYLDRLQRELGETVFFCLLDDGQVLYLEKIESQQSVRTACTVGSRAPAQAAYASASK